MDPRMAVLLALIAERFLLDGPEAIAKIRAAFNNADPTAEDFEGLIADLEAQRPVDPLKK
jgi:hypothetical protein